VEVASVKAPMNKTFQVLLIWFCIDVLLLQNVEMHKKLVCRVGSVHKLHTLMNHDNELHNY